MMGQAMDTLAARLREIVGERGIVPAGERDAYERDWRDAYRGKAAAVVKPASTDEVSRVVALLAREGVAIVPQGGNTSLCGGGVPDGSGQQVIVNLSRMNRVRAVDTENNTMTVEAGCVLAAIQAEAATHGRLFPLSLGAEGSCEIGGNLSTNAGGTGVLRYGNTRELVLGLEVVLPDGRVWDGLRGLRKDNTGYDLKHLFVGAEGTLGIITAAVLKLFPMPRAFATAFVAIASPAEAVQLLSALRAAVGERIAGFELFSRVCVDMVVKNIPGTRDPLPGRLGWFVLVELADSTDASSLNAVLEDALASAIDAGIAVDAMVCASEAQRRELWKMREEITEAQKPERITVKHDISVPVSRVPDFIARAGTALQARFPDIRIVAFGHVGDGNIHYNTSNPDAGSPPASSPEVNRIVYDTVAALEGSISAEHGLGVLKRDEIAHYKGALELELMRAVKHALDPRGLMNPGKVLPAGMGSDT